MSPAIIFVVYLYIMSPGSMCIVHDIADDSVSTCSVYFCTYIDDNVMCVATLFLSTSTRLLDLMNENPDRFYKIVEGRLYDEARRAASAFLGAKAENLVFVPNATTGKTYCILYKNVVKSMYFTFRFGNQGKHV